MKKILVIGSLSTDFVVKTQIKPNQGETVFGDSFETVNGGKGANQAVAASRLGGKVSMLGCVGSDIFGQEIKANLKANQVDDTFVEPVTQIASGSAHITLFEQDNSIIVVPGANNALNEKRIEEIARELEQYDLVIIQNEIPQTTNEAIIDYCWKKQIPLMYNPAPARRIEEKWLEKITYLTPNEHEFSLLFPNETLSSALRKHPNQLIVTLGSKGAIFFDGKKEQMIPSFKVTPIDTTGAGDTFNGALAVAILEGLSLKEAITFANLAASLSVQGFGAQGGMPTITQMKGSQHYEKTWNFK